MVHREQSNDVLIITQPSHAWISGQIAREWGNTAFGDFAPRAEVELAAELHDLGFAKWEQEPTLDESTGLPHTFMSMPLRRHLEIWTDGIHAMTDYGRYPALLVSMHYTWLAQKHPHYESGEHAMLVQDFLETQSAYQCFAFASLRNDPVYAAAAGEDAFTRNRRLISLWDWLSLLICMGKREPERIPEVPMANGLGELVLQPIEKDSSQYTLAPWPFKRESVKLICEAKQLEARYQTTHEMRMALKNAPSVPLQFEFKR
jgi:hypothetical protein